MPLQIITTSPKTLLRQNTMDFSPWKLIKKPSFKALLIFVAVTFILFWKFFIKGLMPVPGDILIGTYYPWLNHKWGYEVAVPVKNPLMSDVVSLMYPWRKIAIDYLKEGRLPFWNPSSFLGESLIGNLQVATFNPVNIFFFLPFLSFNFAWSLQVIIQPFLGMICMYLMLRFWRVNNLASIFGAVGYGLSGQMIVWMEYNLLGFSFAVFPLFILIIDKFISEKKLSKIIPLSLIVAFVVFAGYVQLLYYFLLFGFLYLVLMLIFEKTSAIIFFKSVFFFCLTVLVGILISSVQLLPGIETLLTSIRNLDEVAASNAVSFLPLKNLLTALIPDYLGNPATYNYFGQGGYESFVFYTSIVMLICCVWAFGKREQKQRVYILTVFLLLSFVLAIKNPLSELVQNLSFLGLKGSVSSRVLFMYAFCISALSAVGFDYLMNYRAAKLARYPLRESSYMNHSSPQQAARYSGSIIKGRDNLKKVDLFSPKSVLVVGLMLTVIIGIAGAYFYVFLTISGKNYTTFAAGLSNQLNISVRNSVWPFFVSILTFLVIFFRANVKFFGYLLIMLVILDMFRFSSKYVPFTRSDLIFPKTESLNFLANQEKPFRIAVEKGELLTANTWAPYGLESVSGYNILVPKETADYISLINYGKPDKENARFSDIKNFNSKLLDLANAKYIVSLFREDQKRDETRTLLLSGEKYQEIYKEGSLQILKNKNYLERYFTVKEYKVIEDKNETYEYLSSSKFKPSSEVILDKDPKVADLDLCQVKLTGYEGQRYEFNSECNKNSLLFVSAAYHKGWKAFVNGKEEKIIKADGEFMALSLPKGNLRIELSFMPESFTYGALLSLVGALLYLGITIKERVLR